MSVHRLAVLTETVLRGEADICGKLPACLTVAELAGSVAAGHIRLPVPDGMAICVTAKLSGMGVAVAAFGGGIASVGVGVALYGIFRAPLTVWGAAAAYEYHLAGISWPLLRDYPYDHAKR
jgi:hypothetical protein